MKLKTLFCFLCSLLCFKLTAQESAATMINYEFRTPESNEKVDKQHYELLINKLKSNYKGKINFSNQSAFIVTPDIEITQEMEAGEVQSVKVLKIRIALTIQDADMVMVFNEFEKNVIASGDNVKQTITKAINQIKSNEQGLKKFFTKANENITVFYKDNCNKILRSAKVNIDRKEYNRAVDMLKYVPENLDCFGEVEKMFTSIYISSKNLNCKKLLQKALIEEARENYNLALYYLGFVDTDTECYKDVTALFGKIGSKVNNETLLQYEADKLKFTKLTDLQKTIILAENAEKLDVIVHD